MVKLSDYILKFHPDFYNPIRDNYKVSTIRAESKPLNINDYVIATFTPTEKLLSIQIEEHYAMRLKDLTKHEAKMEGYYHPDLLRHELKNIYPDLKDDDYVYIYIFGRSRENIGVLDFKGTHKLINGEWRPKPWLKKS